MEIKRKQTLVLGMLYQKLALYICCLFCICLAQKILAEIELNMRQEK